MQGNYLTFGEMPALDQYTGILPKGGIGRLLMGQQLDTPSGSGNDAPGRERYRIVGIMVAAANAFLVI